MVQIWDELILMNESNDPLEINGYTSVGHVTSTSSTWTNADQNWFPGLWAHTSSLIDKTRLGSTTPFVTGSLIIPAHHTGRIVIRSYAPMNHIVTILEECWPDSVDHKFPLKSQMALDADKNNENYPENLLSHMNSDW